MLGSGSSSNLSNQDNSKSIEGTSQDSPSDLDDDIPF